MKKVQLIGLILLSILIAGCNLDPNSNQMTINSTGHKVHFITTEEYENFLDSGKFPPSGLYLVNMTSEPENLDELLAADGFTLKKDGTLLDENGNLATLFQDESIKPVYDQDLIDNSASKAANPLSGKLVYVSVVTKVWASYEGIFKHESYTNARLTVTPLTINSDNTKVLPIVCDHIIATISMGGISTHQGGQNITKAVNTRKRRSDIGSGGDVNSIYYQYKVIEGDTVVKAIFIVHYTGSHHVHRYDGKIINKTSVPVYFAEPVN